jgi:hypothetical protein
MGGAVPSLPNTPSWHGAQLGEAQVQFYLTFYNKKFRHKHDVHKDHILLTHHRSTIRNSDINTMYIKTTFSLHMTEVQ